MTAFMLGVKCDFKVHVTCWDGFIYFSGLYKNNVKNNEKINKLPFLPSLPSSLVAYLFLFN
tara:strand:+ start:1443 stop:1625 length:183 start_codon:yes stop_codon:yes gene_type:complete